MKKAFSLILLMVYFVVSTGFTVNLHYCMDRMASVELGSKESEDCDKCGMPIKDKDGCCRDEIMVVKLYQDQVSAHFIDFQLSAVATLVIPSEFLITSFRNTSSFTSHKAHAPPLISKQDAYLVNCVFRI